MSRLVPAARVRRAELLSRSHSERAVSQLTGIARSTIHMLKCRGWQPADAFKRFRARPTDFAIQVRHMTRGELCAHYHCSVTCITRWRRELPS